jgi:hypothetical protein
MLGLIKKINTVVAVAGTVYTTYETMVKVAKWFEKKHGNKKKNQPIVRPIIKGQ